MSHHYGIWGRFLAWFVSRDGSGYYRFVEDRKRMLLEGLRGTVVEIGAGTGRNLPFLAPELRVVAVEPNPFMVPYFRANVRHHDGPVHFVRGMAESLPFADESVDGVLSTLVLCSVGEQGRALAEVLRILKPGGRFMFMEHVAAPDGTRLRRIQSFIRPLWRTMGDGCEPDRTTGDHLARAGFREVRLESFTAPVPLVSPHIAGIAIK